VGNFLTSWEPVSFSRRILLLGVSKYIREAKELEERIILRILWTCYVWCPPTYQTRHFFNNSKTNKYSATKQTNTTDTFLFISHTTNVLLFRSHCNIFICFKIIKEMPGLISSGTPCIFFTIKANTVFTDARSHLWNLLIALSRTVVITATETLPLVAFIRSSYHILRISFQFWVLFVYNRQRDESFLTSCVELFTEQ